MRNSRIWQNCQQQDPQKFDPLTSGHPMESGDAPGSETCKKRDEVLWDVIETPPTSETTSEVQDERLPQHPFAQN